MGDACADVAIAFAGGEGVESFANHHRIGSPGPSVARMVPYRAPCAQGAAEGTVHEGPERAPEVG